MKSMKSMKSIGSILIKSTLPLTMALSSTASSAQSDFLEEVIITAQKREQGLQHVPIAVTAFSGDQLEDLGADVGFDLTKFIPNVDFTSGGPNQNLAIRGVTLGDFGDANESPIGFYVDEVYRGTLSGQTAQLFDVDRVEVLRGPQGTLFGRNTTGGLFHVVTRKPTDEFELYGNFQYGDDNQVIVDGAVSGALSDTMRGRISFKYNNDDGWQESQVNGKNFGATDVWAVRAQLEMDLSPDATLLLSVNGSEQKNTAAVYGFVGNTDINTSVLCSDAEILSQASNCVTVGGLQPKLDADKPFTDVNDLRDDVDIFDASAKLSWDISDDISLTSITAYGSVEKFYEEDFAGPSGGTPWLAEYSVDATQFTQELRLNGSTEKMNWIVGGFYFNDDKDDGYNAIPLFGIRTDFVLDSESWAAFGQVEYDLTEQLELIAGVRYTVDDKELVASGFGSSTSPGFNTDSVTWKFGLNWNPNEDTMWYASVSKGFKSGAFNTTLLSQAADADPVGEEELISYELGWKSTLWNGLARFNGALFYSDYSDMQGVNFESACVCSRLTAIGDADIMGAELELTISPIDELDLIMSAGWVDTEINSNALVGGVPIDGNTLSDSPEFNFSAVGIYTMDLGDKGSLSSQLSASWRDEAYSDLENETVLRQDDYWLLGARLKWESPDENFSVALFGENLTDEEYHVSGFNLEGIALAYIWAGKPTRTWGLKLGYKY